MAIANRTKLLLGLTTLLVILVLQLSRSNSVDSFTPSVTDQHLGHHGSTLYYPRDHAEGALPLPGQALRRAPPRPLLPKPPGQGSAGAAGGVQGATGSLGSAAGPQAQPQQPYQPGLNPQGGTPATGQGQGHPGQAAGPSSATTTPEDVGRGLMNLMCLTQTEINNRMGFDLSRERSKFQVKSWTEDSTRRDKAPQSSATSFEAGVESMQKRFNLEVQSYRTFTRRAFTQPQKQQNPGTACMAKPFGNYAS